MISENIRDIRIRICANPIRFYLKGWKLEGNTNIVIRDIRIRSVSILNGDGEQFSVPFEVVPKALN